MPKFTFKNKKTGILVIIAIIFVFLFFEVTYKIPQKELVPTFPDKEIQTQNFPKSAEPIKTTLEINNIKYESEIVGVISVYDFMDKLRKEGKINFTEKTYVGMGKLIEEINGLKNNGDKYWIYYINGKEAQVGVSNYKINPGDVVSWKYK